MQKFPRTAHDSLHVPRKLVYPQMPVSVLLTRTAAEHPDYVAMTFNETDTTYGELNDKVNRFVVVLQKAGLRKGDRVALVLVNSPTYVIAFFAVLKLGGIVVNLSVGIVGDELAFCLNNAGVETVITLDMFAANIYAVIGRTKVKQILLHSVFGLEKKLVFEPGVPAPRIFNDLLATVEQADEPATDAVSEDVAVLQYTSGSTGTPKAATLSHANLMASIVQTDAWIAMTDDANAAVMCLIPFFHVFGLLSCLCVCVQKGYRMILLPRIDLLDILSLMKLLETYRPIFFPAVPSLWNAILNLPSEKAKSQLVSIRVAINGGAPFTGAVHEKFTALTGRRMMEAYGLSEASSATHMTPYPEGGPTGSIGFPLPDTQAKVMDLETGLNECAVGEVGELAVKGPQIMKGYWNNATLTNDVLRDGWFFTQDLARVDENGFFYLVDRKDDLIISNGFNIYPGQVEEVLKTHPAVRDAAVVGMPDRSRGQALVAVLALKDGMKMSVSDLMRFCRKHLPAYRLPKTIVFRDALPRDPSGKLLRRQVKQELEQR